MHKLHKERRRKLMYRNNHLRRQFGIDLEQYDELLTKQAHVCAVCKKPETAKKKNGTVLSLAVDHDHDTGRVRGLLCQRCNIAIGLFRENPVLFAEAVKYLNKENSVLN